VEAKRPLNSTSKVNTQTDKQTNRQTYGHFDLKKESAQRAVALKIPHTADTDSLGKCG
jgi:hypothetical protein